MVQCDSLEALHNGHIDSISRTSNVGNSHELLSVHVHSSVFSGSIFLSGLEFEVYDAIPMCFWAVFRCGRAFRLVSYTSWANMLIL